MSSTVSSASLLNAPSLREDLHGKLASFFALQHAARRDAIGTSLLRMPLLPALPPASVGSIGQLDALLERAPQLQRELHSLTVAEQDGHARGAFMQVDQVRLARIAQAFARLTTLHFGRCALNDPVADTMQRVPVELGCLDTLPLEALSFEQCTALTGDFRGLPATVTRLTLESCSLQGPLRGLGHLRELQHLGLGGNVWIVAGENRFVGAQDLVDLELDGFPQLRSLRLQSCDIDRLDMLPARLEVLALEKCRRLPTALDLGRFTRLQSLTLCDAAATLRLDRLPAGLKALSLAGCAGVEEDLQQLASLTQLRTLDLGRVRGTERQLRHLPPGLEHLSLADTNCGLQDIVRGLARQFRLKTLDVSRCWELTGRLDGLRAALPGVAIRTHAA